MPRLVCRALLATLLVTGLTSTAPPGLSATEDVVLRVVEIPGSGFTVALPVEWRVWPAEQRGHPTGILATDVAARQICHFSLMEGVTSAERAAHRTVELVEAHPQQEVMERTFLNVPAGNAVRVAYRLKDAPDGARFVLNEYYLTVPDGVVSAYCSGDEPPADRWLSIVEAIAPFVSEPPPSAPFDPRVEVPAHGFAMDFGAEWLVRSWPGPGPVLGGYLVLRAVTVASENGSDGYECEIEDDTVLPTPSDIRSLEEWREILISFAQAQERQTSDPVVTGVDLPFGHAVRADWQHWSREPAAAWIFLDSDGHAAAALLCRSDEPPDDHWLSIAETFEFLPGEG